MPNRTIAPPIKDIENLHLPEPEVYQLDNGIPVYQINMGTQDVLKLEVVYNAGRPYERKKMISRATAGLLKEGTEQYDSATLAELVDFYGGTLSVPASLDTSTLVLYSLTKYADQLLPIVADILSKPVFDQKEMQSFIQRNQQSLQVDLSRNDVVAYRQITELIFGDHHPYGYNSQPEDYAQIQRDDLIQHFQDTFHSGSAQIFVSGKLDSRIKDLLNTHLGQAIPKGTAKLPYLPEPTSKPEKSKLERPNTVQTAIRIGRRLFNRQHPDFNGLYVLNTILGGYFGSRLMENIREDKGFTYNIYSALDTMLFDGYFYVATEVGNEFVKATLNEIYREMEILQETLAEEEELQMVRNYLLGNMLTSLDGPFNISEVIKTQITENLPANAFEDLVNTIKTITAEELRQLAQKYFRKEDMWEVVVGV